MRAEARFRGVVPYVSPRQRRLTPGEAQIRDFAWALKRADPRAVRLAARVMAPHVPLGAVLVPIPSSTGDLAPNLALARALARKTGADVFSLVQRARPVESSSRRRQAGLPGLPLRAQRVSLVASRPVPRDRPVVLVDNVMTSGRTFAGAYLALGGHPNVLGLAFAKARRANPTFSLVPLRALHEATRLPEPFATQARQALRAYASGAAKALIAEGGLVYTLLIAWFKAHAIEAKYAVAFDPKAKDVVARLAPGADPNACVLFLADRADLVFTLTASVPLATRDPLRQEWDALLRAVGWEAKDSPTAVHVLYVQPQRRRALRALNPPASGRDLEGLWARVRAAFFPELPDVRVAWSPRVSHRRWAVYKPRERRIEVNVRLSEPDVPEEVVAFQLFHEGLHALLPLESHAHHGPRFREMERTFPRFGEIERWQAENQARLFQDEDVLATGLDRYGRRYGLSSRDAGATVTLPSQRAARVLGWLAGGGDAPIVLAYLDTGESFRISARGAARLLGRR